MMTQYQISLQGVPEHPLYADSAYRLYAWLLEQLPEEAAFWLHESGSAAISQFLRYDFQNKQYLWTLNLLSERACECLIPALEGITQVWIENRAFPVTGRAMRSASPEDLIRLGQEHSSRRSTLFFYSPTAFKQNGRYTIFPQEKLILQSLMMRWNEIFPEYSLNDMDAFQAMLSGIHVTDYQLRSTRFPLKGVRIPGFTGSCILEAKLPLPLLELWNTLLLFANYAGIGIKTGLGMGGTCAKQPLHG